MPECVWCMHTCVCVLDMEGSWMFAGTALVIAWMALHLNVCTGLKNVWLDNCPSILGFR